MSEVRETFEELVAELDYPMFIVTTVAEGEPSGCLLGFATQSSIDPPRFLICLSKKNRTYRLASGAAAVAVHMVPEDATDLVELFGGETGDEVRKFERCDWHEGPEGLPIIEGCTSWFAARILSRLDAGDHEALLLDPFDAHKGHGDEPFPFHRAKRIEPGHEP